jgi:hypothetical protein
MKKSVFIFVLFTVVSNVLANGCSDNQLNRMNFSGNADSKIGSLLRR